MTKSKAEREEKKEISYPKGFSDEAGFKKVSVKFTEQLFKDIINMAKREEKSFNSMVIELVLVGKLDLDESDALEPLPSLKLPAKVTT